MFKSYQRNNQQSSQVNRSTSLSSSQNSFYKRKNLPEINPSEKSDPNSVDRSRSNEKTNDYINIVNGQDGSYQNDKWNNMKASEAPNDMSFGNGSIDQKDFTTFKSSNGLNPVPEQISLPGNSDAQQDRPKFQFKTTGQSQQTVNPQTTQRQDVNVSGYRQGDFLSAFSPAGTRNYQANTNAPTVPVKTSTGGLGPLNNLAQFINPSGSVSQRMIQKGYYGHTDFAINDKYGMVPVSNRMIEQSYQPSPSQRVSYQNTKYNPPMSATQPLHLKDFQVRQNPAFNNTFENLSQISNQNLQIGKGAQSYSQPKNKVNYEDPYSQNHYYEQQKITKSKSKRRQRSQDQDSESEEEEEEVEEEPKPKNRSKSRPKQNKEKYLPFIRQEETPRYTPPKNISITNFAELTYIFLGRIEVLRLSERKRPKIFDPEEAKLQQELKSVKNENDGLRSQLHFTDSDRSKIRELERQKQELEHMLETANKKLSSAGEDIKNLKAQLESITDQRKREQAEISTNSNLREVSQNLSLKIADLEAKLSAEMEKNNSLLGDVKTLQEKLFQQDFKVLQADQIIGQNKSFTSEVLLFLQKLGMAREFDPEQTDPQTALQLFKRYSEQLRGPKIDPYDLRPLGLRTPPQMSFSPPPANTQRVSPPPMSKTQPLMFPDTTQSESNVKVNPPYNFNNTDTMSKYSEQNQIQTRAFVNPRSPSPSQLSQASRMTSTYDGLRQQGLTSTSSRAANLKKELSKLKQKVINLEEKAHETVI